MRANRVPNVFAECVMDVVNMWADHGYELRQIAGSRFYLAKFFPEQVFVVRHAMDTRLLPALDHRFRIISRNNVTGVLGSQERWACGVDDVSSIIRAWRSCSLRQNCLAATG